MQDVMHTVIKIMNFVWKQSLKHRQFQQLLPEMYAENGNLSYYCEVCVYVLHNEIAVFVALFYTYNSKQVHILVAFVTAVPKPYILKGCLKRTSASGRRDPQPRCALCLIRPADQVQFYDLDLHSKKDADHWFKMIKNCNFFSFYFNIYHRQTNSFVLSKGSLLIIACKYHILLFMC
jgi:hypothetical protein